MRRLHMAKNILEEEERRNREELFKQNLAITAAAAAKKRRRADRNAENLRIGAEKTTDLLNSLVLRMNEQVKQSEETTTSLAHSSAVLKETHSNFLSVSMTVRSGGKLLSKYARRETTDKILIVLALILYFGVIFYILRKRLLWVDWFWFLPF